MIRRIDSGHRPARCACSGINSRFAPRPGRHTCTTISTRLRLNASEGTSARKSVVFISSRDWEQGHTGLQRLSRPIRQNRGEGLTVGKNNSWPVSEPVRGATEGNPHRQLLSRRVCRRLDASSNRIGTSYVDAEGHFVIRYMADCFTWQAETKITAKNSNAFFVVMFATLTAIKESRRPERDGRKISRSVEFQTE